MALLSDSVAQNTPAPEQEKRLDRKFNIRRAAVLGAGTMGARIAAHIANAGLPVLLLDMVPEKGDRNSMAATALNNLKGAKPAAFAVPSLADHISIGNFEDDLHKLRDCDWVIEAVAENLEIKRNLLSKIAAHLSPEAILTTNTSGLPVAQIGAQLPEPLRRRWFGTHFFNPPRYMRLLEVIATPDTDPAAMAAIAEFADRQLGKTVVPANDVANFIANRVGTFLMLNTFKIMQDRRSDGQKPVPSASRTWWASMSWPAWRETSPRAPPMKGQTYSCPASSSSSSRASGWAIKRSKASTRKNAVRRERNFAPF
jgi:3-hydroxyacyl-CoA dehydrogenase